MKKVYIIMVLLIIALAGFRVFTTDWNKVQSDIEKSKNYSPYLNNDQIIKETQKCEKAGLKAGYVYNGWNHKIREIICEPKK